MCKEEGTSLFNKEEPEDGEDYELYTLAFTRYCVGSSAEFSSHCFYTSSEKMRLSWRYSHLGDWIGYLEKKKVPFPELLSATFLKSKSGAWEEL